MGVSALQRGQVMALGSGDEGAEAEALAAGLEFLRLVLVGDGAVADAGDLGDALALVLDEVEGGALGKAVVVGGHQAVVEAAECFHVVGVGGV